MLVLSAVHPFRSARARKKYLAHYDRRASEWPLPADERVVGTSDGSTHVRISGPQDGPPVVLLPGISASSLMWSPNVASLAQKYRVHAVDNIFDVGRSVWRRPMRSAKDFANWLDELFTALGLGNDVNLVGASYGGWIAVQYALWNPGRLSRLVLLAPVLTVLPLSAAFIMRAVLCSLPHQWFTKTFIYWLAADAVTQGGAARDAVDAMAEDGYLGLRSFKWKRTVAPTILTDEQLRRISVPTLYVVGENERIYSAHAAVQRLNQVAPQIRTVIVADAGHELTISQTERVNAVMLAFLRSEPARAKKPPSPGG